MYPDTLSKTSVEILGFLAANPGKRFTIRQISKAIQKDYKITYDTMNKLSGRGLVSVEKQSNLTLCRLDPKRSMQFVSFIESMRASQFLKTKPEIGTIVGALLEKIRLPYFTLILYGSHVKGTATKRSDIDMIFILPDRGFEKDIVNEVASIERMAPLGIHEEAITHEQFIQMLREGVGRTNLAREALADHIIPYGAEALLKMLGETP